MIEHSGSGFGLQVFCCCKTHTHLHMRTHTHVCTCTHTYTHAGEGKLSFLKHHCLTQELQTVKMFPSSLKPQVTGETNYFINSHFVTFLRAQIIKLRR